MAKLRLIRTADKQKVLKSPLGIDPKFYDPERDGVTQSLLATFRNCREAARLSLLGWTSSRIGPSLIFGTIVHAALEAIYLLVQHGKLTRLPTEKEIKKLLFRLEKEWKQENPKADAETLQHLEMCVLLAQALLPIYFTYWHKDFTKVRWLALEHEFKLGMLMDGQKTFLRGKMDGRFIPEKEKRTWLLETKTKSRLGEQGESNLVDILPRDLQVNLYLGAISVQENAIPGGVLYNIIRKPNLQPKKGETLNAFAARVASDAKKRPEHYFIRLRMSISKGDLERQMAKRDATLRDFLKWLRGESEHYDNDHYCENKYGTCGFLPICANQDFSRHYRRERVFRELEDS